MNSIKGKNMYVALWMVLVLFSEVVQGGVTIRSEPFEAPRGHFFKGVGVTGTAVKNTSTNIDYKIVETRKILGVHVFLKNHCYDDTMSLLVVDKDGVYAPANTILGDYGKDWNIDSSTESQGKENMLYAATVPTGVYLRAVYTSTCNVNDVKVKINYYLHKTP